MEWMTIAQVVATGFGMLADGVVADKQAKKAKEVLAKLAAITDAVKSGDLTTLDIDKARSELDEMMAAMVKDAEFKAGLDANDAATRDAIEKKFGK